MINFIGHKPQIEGHQYSCFYTIYGNIPHTLIGEEKDILRLKQEHSILLNMVENHPSHVLLGDGVFTRKKNLELAIECRDCMGIIIMGKNFCGVVHMSWKNLYLGIIDKMFQLFKRENMDEKGLSFIICPHITEKYMEVKFKSTWENHSYEGYNLSAAFTTRNSFTYFSMSTLFHNICFLKYNILPQQILSIPVDTYSNLNYASYRRDGLEHPNTNLFIVSRK